MSERVGLCFVITGRVQGVGFRYSTERRARSLGVDGSARNCPDGSVEVRAAGSAEALERLDEWLAHGPQSAQVAQVRRRPIDPQEVAAGFVVL